MAFGLHDDLVIVIPDKPRFYSLYADGFFPQVAYSEDTQEHYFAFSRNSVVFLYYKYPYHRAANVVRNVPGETDLPGLSRKVRLLFSVTASRVDKLKKAVGHLNKNFDSAYQFSDAFYLRLYFIVSQKGKLNYPALIKLAQESKVT